MLYFTFKYKSVKLNISCFLYC